MPSKNLTFQTFLPGCEKGERDSWEAFLANYTPIVFRLLEVYVPQLAAGAKEAFWQDVLKALAADDFKRLREFDHLAEREFLIDLKSFALDLASQRLEKATGEIRHSIESVSSRVKGLPIVHQEIVLLNWGGYTPEAIEKVLSIPGTLVAKALETPAGCEPVSSGGGSPQAVAAWLEFLREVRAARTPDCSPRRLWVRILDGQISWYDKTPAENHMAGCVHCLETWASLREADYLRRTTPLLPEREIAAYWAALPLVHALPRGSWASKLFGR